MNISSIVLNIPHSSDVFPYGKDRWDEGLDCCISRWTDWLTDEIFVRAGRGSQSIVPVIFPWSRFFCDVERLKGDAIGSVGQGIVYTRFDWFSRSISEGEKESVIADYYDTHIERLRSALAPDAFLIDCHSFPPDLSDVEVCIGLNDDWSRPDETLIASVTDIFRRAGYKVGLNTPYSNSISPEMPFPYPSMMIELNKSTYVTPDGASDPNKMQRLESTVGKAYSRILDF